MSWQHYLSVNIIQWVPEKIFKISSITSSVECQVFLLVLETLFFTLIRTSFITFDPENPEGQLPSLWVSVCNTFWKTEDKRERDMDIFSKSLNKRRMYMQPYAHVVLFMYYVSPFLGSIHIYMKVSWLHRTSTTFLGAWGLSVLRVIKSVTDVFSFFCFWQQHWHFSCLYWRILVLYARHIE